MKKKLLLLTLICILLSLICGCTNEIPEFLPGENEGDFQFVWVCKEPFGFFSLTENDEGYNGYLKGYMEKEGELSCFESAFEMRDGKTYFEEGKIWDGTSEYESFWAYGDYYENYFELEIERDLINFFGGELPTLRFDKMTKDAFLEQYRDIENVSELLE